MYNENNLWILKPQQWIYILLIKKSNSLSPLSRTYCIIVILLINVYYYIKPCSIVNAVNTIHRSHLTNQSYKYTSMFEIHTWCIENFESLKLT